MTESEISEIIQAKRYFQNGLYWGEFESPIKNYVNTAVNALEKQIPKKPNKRHSIKFGDSYNDGECPVCKATYSDCLSDTPLYCSQCGQRFDWGDDNE